MKLPEKSFKFAITWAQRIVVLHARLFVTLWLNLGLMYWVLYTFLHICVTAILLIHEATRVAPYYSDLLYTIWRWKWLHIQPQEHSAVGDVPIHPKGIQWGWGQGSLTSSLAYHVFMVLSLCRRTLSYWNRFSSNKGKSQWFNMKKNSRQLCAFKFLGKVWIRTTEGCDCQVPTDFWLYSVYRYNSSIMSIYFQPLIVDS